MLRRRLDEACDVEPYGKTRHGSLAAVAAAVVDPNEPQLARRRTSQRVMTISSTASASSQPPSIHWNAQNRLAG